MRRPVRLLERSYQRVLTHPEDIEARGAMQLGAYYAGTAIESSMLGATHACANPLTAHYGTTHGVAIALLLPRVVRWNAEVVGFRYRDLVNLSAQASSEGEPSEALAQHLEQLAKAGGLPSRLRSVGVPENDLKTLAEEAAKQWTGRHNPRPFDAAGALEVYQWAY